MVQQGSLKKWAARVELSGLKRPYCAFMFSRDEMYLCANDLRLGLKNVFRQDQPGSRLFRGLPSAGDTDVSSLNTQSLLSLTAVALQNVDTLKPSYGHTKQA
jgi:hypothetical protein